MRLAILLAIAVSLGGCTKKKSCDEVDRILKVASQSAATFLDCSNPEAILKDMQDKVDAAGMCEGNRLQGVIQDLVCPRVVAYVKNKIVELSLPKEWGCKGGVPAEMLEKFLVNKCKNS